MELIPPGLQVDFLAHRKALLGVSALLVVLSIAAQFWPGPSLGIDFRGGAELELELGSEVSLVEVQRALRRAGVSRAQVSTDAEDPERVQIRLAPDAARPVERAEDEAAGGALLDRISAALGERATPRALRLQWVQPQLGAEARAAALQAMLLSLVLVALYVTFRFDLRFAPGGVLALAHDALITLGALVLLRREVTLASIAAVLVVIGYSLVDTIVVYDRIRENTQRMRDATLYQVINASTSQAMSRTLVMSGTSCLAVLGFLVWGTPDVRNLAVVLLIGFAVGTYSSLYVAAGITEWLDRHVFRPTSRRASFASKA